METCASTPEAIYPLQTRVSPVRPEVQVPHSCSRSDPISEPRVPELELHRSPVWRAGSASLNWPSEEQCSAWDQKVCTIRGKIFIAQVRFRNHSRQFFPAAAAPTLPIGSANEPLALRKDLLKRHCISLGFPITS